MRGRLGLVLVPVLVLVLVLVLVVGLHSFDGSSYGVVMVRVTRW